MVAVYVGDELASYAFGNGHPFGPDRLHAFWDEVVRSGLDRRLGLLPPVTCTEQDLLLFHDAPYVDRVRHASTTGGGYLDCGDTPAFRGVFEAACWVVGSTLDAIRQVLVGTEQRVFVPIAGLHHARRGRAGGFCVFNDVGIAIEALRRRYGVRRIAYVDIDAHHGDGVYYSFEDDPDLIIADVHEDGRFLYPGSGSAQERGRGPAVGTKMNVPLAPGSDDEDFHRLWPELETFVREHAPEIVLLQAGADSLAGDPIADLAFSPAAHYHAASRLSRVADDLCEGRLVAMGGGGYHRGNLARAWTEVLRALLEQH